MGIFYFILFVVVMLLLIFALLRRTNRSQYQQFPHSLRFYQCRQLALTPVCLLFFSNGLSLSFLMYLAAELMRLPRLAKIWNAILAVPNAELAYAFALFLLCNLFYLLLFNLCLALFYRYYPIRGNIIFPRELGVLGKIVHWPWLLVQRYYRLYGESEECLVETRIVHKPEAAAAYYWVSKMRGIYRVFLLLLAVLALVESLVVIPFVGPYVDRFLTTLYLIPMAALLCIEQFASFLEYVLEPKDAGVLDTTEIKSKFEVDLETVMNFYKKKFPHALLHAKLTRKEKWIQASHSSGDISQDQRQSCKHTALLNVMKRQMNCADLKFCDSFTNAAIELMNGGNVFVADLLQGEFLAYLLAANELQLALRQTIVILVSDVTKVDDLKTDIEEQLKRLNGVAGIWRCNSLQNEMKESIGESGVKADILICGIEQLLNWNLLQKMPQFFGRCGLIVLGDTMDFFRRDACASNRLFAEIRKIGNKPRFAVFSDVLNERAATGAEELLAAQLRPAIHEVFEGDHLYLIWKQESYYRIQRALNIGEELATTLDMGVALPLLLVGEKLELPHKYIIPSAEQPQISAQEILKGHMSEVARFLDREPDLDLLSSYLRTGIGRQSEFRFLILHDCEYNFVSCLAPWIKYGGLDYTVIHVITPQYLLRDYMVAHFDAMMSPGNRIRALVPHKKTSLLNVAIELLIEMALAEGGAIGGTAIMARASTVLEAPTSLYIFLRKCLEAIVGAEITDIHSYMAFDLDCRYDPTHKQFREEVQVRLLQASPEIASENVLEKIKQLTRRVRLIGIASGEEYDDSVLAADVYNHYLPGQFIVHSERRYVVRSIVSETGEVHVAEQQQKFEQTYIPVSYFSIENAVQSLERPSTEALQGGNQFIQCKRFSASLKRKLYGYWTCVKGYELYVPLCYHFDILSVPESTHYVPDQCRSVQFLEVCLTGMVFREAEKTARLLAVMLNGFFMSYFPKNHPDLFVAIPYQDERGEWFLSQESLAHVQEDQRLMSMTPTILWENQPALSPVATASSQATLPALYIIAFSEADFGLLDSIESSLEDMLYLVMDYLGWCTSNEMLKEPSFLKFGYGFYSGELEFSAETAEAKKSKSKKSKVSETKEYFPPVFAIEELKAFCEKACFKPIGVTEDEKSNSLPDGAYVCSFCYRTTMSIRKLEDGRQICKDCKDHQLTSRQQVRELYQDTVDQMQLRYGIIVPKDLKIKFKRSDEINRQIKTSHSGRVLGFYAAARKEIWVEGMGPRVDVQAVLVHELTHAWQHAELDRSFLPKFDEYVEGHARYVEIEFMRLQRFDHFAERLEESTMLQQDVYGKGYRLLKKEMEQWLAAAKVQTTEPPYTVFVYIKECFGEGGSKLGGATVQ